MILAIHPAARYPAKSALLATFLSILAALLWLLLPPMTALFLVLAMLFNLLDYWLPTTYRLDESGLEMCRGPWTHKFPWNRFKSFLVDGNGILFSPFNQRHSLENFRGTFVALPSEMKGEVVSWLLAQPQALLRLK